MGVSEPVLHVETAQQIRIALRAVGIVDVARLEKPEPAGFGGLDDPLQPRFGKFPVADERDALDAGLGAFPDLENNIGAPDDARKCSRMACTSVRRLPSTTIVGSDATMGWQRAGTHSVVAQSMRLIPTAPLPLRRDQTFGRMSSSGPTLPSESG